ncbi:HAD-IIA family hydrolase [Lysobacter korlensis]|uniref:HAD-IIA family hydrolase n=1 Tax=Lysobacter korlensis TaxID=553636 RepID=A0ABV6RYN7_9GAMM
MRRDPAPIDGVDVLLADLDGVIYRGADAIPHAVDSINAASATRRVGYITNNASRTAASVAQHLTELGLRVLPDDVVTSPQAAVRLLADTVPAGSKILVVGGEGLTFEVERAGFTVTRSAEDEPAAVIQGFAPEVGWTQLAEAAFALQGGDDGIPWIATNTDWTLPLARGTAPGNGTLVSAVHTAVGRLPLVAGKPEVAIFEEARLRFNANAPLVLGDRLDTDILGANRAGMDSVLVLTGIDRAKQVLAADKNSRPTFVLEDLRELDKPYPRAATKQRGSAVLTSVGKAVVSRAGNEVRLVRSGTRIDVLRAGAHAIWESGLSIHALRVDPALYS